MKTPKRITRICNVKRTERGWAGHFCCSDRCAFRRNTLLEGNGQKVIVSTVGLFRCRPEDKTLTEIGCDRHYETMVFRASQQGAYLDANVTAGELEFSSPWSIKEATDSSDNDANAMHEVVVAEFTRRIRSGERFDEVTE